MGDRSLEVPSGACNLGFEPRTTLWLGGSHAYFFLEKVNGLSGPGR